MNTRMYRMQLDLMIDALQTDLGLSLGEAVETVFSGSLEVVWDVEDTTELGEYWHFIPRLHCAVKL